MSTPTSRLVFVLAVMLLTWTQGFSSEAFAQRGALKVDKQGFAQAADDPELDIATKSITLEAWIKHDGNSDENAVIVSKSDGSNIDYELTLVGQGEEVPVRFDVYYEDYGATSTVGVPAGVWTHVLGTYNGSVVAIYINGEPAGSKNLTSTPHLDNNPLTIGADMNGTRAFSGLIDEVHVWNVSRLPFEVKGSVYQSPVGTEAGLVAAYNFNALAAGEVPDLAGAARNNLQLVGNAQLAVPGVLPVPSELVAVPSNASATLHWTERLGNNNVNQASQFKIYRSTAANGSDRQLLATLPAGTISYTDTNLTNGNVYYYEITSTDAAGKESDYSVMATIVPANSHGGGALSVSGGGFAQVSDRPSLDLKEKAITVEAWIKHDGNSQENAVVLSKSDGSNIDYELTLVGQGEEVPVRFDVYYEDYGATSTVGVPAGVWTHLVGTYNGSTVSIYVNGQLVGTKGLTSAPDLNDNPLTIGADMNGTRAFSGLIDEVSIWSGVRTAAEVAQDYQQPFAGNEAKLVGYYRFDEIGVSAAGANAVAHGSENSPATMLLVGDAQIVGAGFLPIPPEVFALARNGSAHLSWRPRTTGLPTSYQLYRSTRPDGSDRQLLAQDIAPTTTTYVDANLNTGTTYYYQVVGADAQQRTSDYSPMTSATIGTDQSVNALSVNQNGWAEVADRPSLDLKEKAITVEAWIKHDGNSQENAVVLSKSDGSNIDYELTLVEESGQIKARFDVYYEDYGATSTMEIPIDEWTHLAGTYNGATVSIYVNGQLAGTKGLTSAPDLNNNPLTIGGASDGTRLFSGLIDEVRIWNKARTATEVQQLYSQVLTGNEANLVAYFRFDETSGNIAYGSDAAPKTALLTGGATFAPSGSPVPVEQVGTDLPSQFTLSGNYPNPFNPQTTIRYGLSQAAPVRLAVYNALGREVAVLVDGMEQAAGWYEVSFDAAHLPSGLYLYRIEAGSLSGIGRMMLAK